MISESGCSTLTCHMRCFITGALPAFSVISWLVLRLPSPALPTHMHCQTHPPTSKLSFPDHYLERANILLLPLLLHLPICWLPTHPSCVSQISSLGGFLPPVISRLLSSSPAVSSSTRRWPFFSFTPLAMPPCTVVEVVHWTRSSRPMGKWRLKPNLHLTCQTPPGALPLPWKGAPFVIDPQVQFGLVVTLFYPLPAIVFSTLHRDGWRRLSLRFCERVRKERTISTEL